MFFSLMPVTNRKITEKRTAPHFITISLTSYLAPQLSFSRGKTNKFSKNRPFATKKKQPFYSFKFNVLPTFEANADRKDKRRRLISDINHYHDKAWRRLSPIQADNDRNPNTAAIEHNSTSRRRSRKRKSHRSLDICLLASRVKNPPTLRLSFARFAGWRRSFAAFVLHNMADGFEAVFVGCTAKADDPCESSACQRVRWQRRCEPHTWHNNARALIISVVFFLFDRIRIVSWN